MLKIDQPKISRLLGGRLSGFSTERLMHFWPCLPRRWDHRKACSAITPPRARVVATAKSPFQRRSVI